MKVPLLDLSAQYDSIKDEVLPAVLSVVESQKFIMGEAVSRLEEAVARLCNTRFAVACASGTDALLLSLKTLDLERGAEVITSPFTFFASAGAIHNAGGTPVFVDIDLDTYNLDVDQAGAAITERTRGIVPVHLYGQMAAIERLMVLAEERGVAIVEDAAQAIGARRKIEGSWRMAGELGVTGAFSFFPAKNLGGWGDGGMIVTSEEERAERLRRLRAHGGVKMYQHNEVGTNSRLDTLHAAVLLMKLPRLANWNAARRKRADVYTQAFRGIEGIVTPKTDADNEHIFHQYTIRAERREELREYLRNKGVGCGVYYPKPLHLQACFEELGYKKGFFPSAEKAAAEVISLPMYPELDGQAQEYVIETVRSFYE